MQLNAKDLTADSLEKLFCIPFSNLQQYPMTSSVSELMIKLLFGDMEKSPESEKADEELNKGMMQTSWVYMAMKKRAETMLGVKINIPVFTFITYISPNIATCMMYIYYLQYWAKTHGKKEINMENFAYAFGNGFPCEADLKALWYTLKVKKEGDSHEYNLIDIPSCAESIMFKTVSSAQ